uniref:Uncharacterized protein n=1 Tax=Arundo donax TaxID=35708 RepID=A0A0A9CRB6_ARUDO
MSIIAVCLALKLTPFLYMKKGYSQRFNLFHNGLILVSNLVQSQTLWKWLRIIMLTKNRRSKYCLYVWGISCHTKCNADYPLLSHSSSVCFIACTRLVLQ